MNWQIVSQGILKFKKCRVKNEVETNVSLHNCFMRVRIIKRPVWTIENRKKSENTYRASNSFKQPQTASKSHKETSKISVFFGDNQSAESFAYLLFLTQNPFYLINDRWGLRGQSGWLAYWLVRDWWCIWANPPWCPSFVIFFVI